MKRAELKQIVLEVIKEDSKGKIDVHELKDYMTNNYLHIDFNLSDKEIQRFLNQHKDTKSIIKMADFFSDYLLSQGLATDVQESIKSLKLKSILKEDILPSDKRGDIGEPGSDPGNLVGGKTVKMQLVGLDGNAFNLMGHFQKNARKQGWTQEEIKKVLDQCMSGDYDHLLVTLMNHIEEPD